MLVVFAALRQCQCAAQTLQVLGFPPTFSPDLAVHHIAANLIMVCNYKDLGEFDWKSNYKGNKTQAELREDLTGVIKPSFTFKCPEHFDIVVWVSALCLPLLGMFAQGLCGRIEQMLCGLFSAGHEKNRSSASFSQSLPPTCEGNYHIVLFV